MFFRKHAKLIKSINTKLSLLVEKLEDYQLAKINKSSWLNDILTEDGVLAVREHISNYEVDFKEFSNPLIFSVFANAEHGFCCRLPSICSFIYDIQEEKLLTGQYIKEGVFYCPLDSKCPEQVLYNAISFVRRKVDSLDYLELGVSN